MAEIYKTMICFFMNKHSGGWIGKMERLTKHLIVVSFDGFSTSDLDIVSEMPGFKAFLEEAGFCRKVYSIYPTVTYPAHATIVTGQYPRNHGIINNTLLQPGRESPDWYWHRKYIKSETIYDLAVQQGMTAAALLWPVTAGASIQYNMPEIFANRPWQNQIFVSLRSGSPLFQLDMDRKFGHLRKGIKQPNLDNFTHQALLDTLRNKRPDITLVHYTDLDTMRHYTGYASSEARAALERHDARLGDIITALKENDIYQDSTIIVLGDHSSLEEDKIINLNVLLKKKGYIYADEKGKVISYSAICKTCDGSTYVYTKNKDEKFCKELYDIIKEFNDEYDCVEAIYNGPEAAELGADPECTFMLEAKKGYYFLDALEGELVREIQPGEAGVVPHVTLSTHGYSPNKPDYTTVFLASGKGIKKGVEIPEMSLIDEGPTLARLLGLSLKAADGKIIEELLDMDRS